MLVTKSTRPLGLVEILCIKRCSHSRFSASGRRSISWSELSTSGYGYVVWLLLGRLIPIFSVDCKEDLVPTRPKCQWHQGRALNTLSTKRRRSLGFESSQSLQVATDLWMCWDETERSILIYPRVNVFPAGYLASWWIEAAVVHSRGVYTNLYGVKGDMKERFAVCV